jgi:HAD superfamily hydrolase (TIGR01549 family)
MKKIRKPSGIIFDLGNTVLHEVSYDTLAGNRRLLELAEYNPGVTAGDIQKIAGEVYGWMDPARDESMLEISFETYNRLFYEPLGVTFRVGYDELEKEFWKAACNYVPAPGICSLLDMLQANQIKTGIISNSIFSASTLTKELEKHNLARYFQFIMSSADYGIRKPHKAIFQIAVKKMGLEESAIWFVGDKPEYDIKGALDAGLNPVWYNWQDKPGTIDGDYLEIKSLDELKSEILRLYGT